MVTSKMVKDIAYSIFGICVIFFSMSGIAFWLLALLEHAIY